MLQFQILKMGKQIRLVTFSFTQQPCENETLLTEISRHQYSEEYIALTRDYYLNM